MRLPPDKASRSVMSQRDVASANSTLNTFLGPRKRPWIASGSTERPLQNTVSQPNRPPSTSLLEDPPAISNLPASRDESNTTASVLLSPAPSEVPSPAPSQRSITQISRDGPWELSRGEGDQEFVHISSTPPLHTRTISDLRSSGRRSPIPSYTDNVLRSPSPIDTTQPNQAAPISGHSSHQNLSLPMPAPLSATPPVPNLHAQGHPPSSDGTADFFYSTQAVNKRKRSEQVLVPWLKKLLPIIDNHVKVYPLNSDFEKPRIHLLREACFNGDAFYVALHQIFCLWSIDQQVIQMIPGIREYSNLTFSFETIGHWLRRNDGLASHHLRWFSEFPSPLSDLVAKSAPYRDAVADVGLFLKKMASDWPSFFQQCRARGYPPLVDEMLNHMKLPSPMLRRIMFIASRRNMQIHDGPLGEAVDQIFAEDQRSHQQLASQSVSPTLVNERNQRISMQYNAVLGTRGVPPQMQQATSISNATRPSSINVLPSNASTSSTIIYHNRRLSNPATVVSTPQHNYSSPYATPVQFQQPVQRQASNPNTLRSNYVNQTSFHQQQPAHQPQEQQHFRYRQQSTVSNPPVAPRSRSFNGNSASNTTLSSSFGPISPLPNTQTVASPRITQTSVTVPQPMRHNSTQPAVTWSRPLVPLAGFTQPPGPVNADMTALHQAHLASPHLIPLDGPKNTRFYQSVKGFALQPQKIPLKSSLSTFEFRISDTDWIMVAKDKKVANEPLPLRCFKRGTLQYRLRCVCLPSNSDSISAPDWVICDTTWPATIFLEINDHLLEVRRKAHHGKDLPIDITPFIIPANSGKSNILKLAVMKVHKPNVDVNYYAAIEIIEILKHKQILDMCIETQHISTSQALDGITRSLTKPLSMTPDDDEVAMVVNDLSIDLADPFTAKIFDIPVRGRSCLHRECFDLEIYLQTRPSKPKCPGQPCMVDVWKCPLCKKDARPYTLAIDDFLASVRASLAEQDRLDVKAILVSADGSWKPKPEPPIRKRRATEDSDESDEDKPITPAISQARDMDWLYGREIIELDD
ncbi:hypothetical protein B7463_g10101, partial [Scytalidium lignicola]